VSLQDRIRRLESRRGIAEKPPWEEACPSCGQLVGRIIFEDQTTYPPSFDSQPPCPTCERLRSELPHSAPINHIVLRDNTRPREENGWHRTGYPLLNLWEHEGRVR